MAPGATTVTWALSAGAYIQIWSGERGQHPSVGWLSRACWRRRQGAAWPASSVCRRGRPRRWARAADHASPGAVCARAARSCRRVLRSVRSRDSATHVCLVPRGTWGGLPQVQGVTGDTGQRQHSGGRRLVESRWQPSFWGCRGLTALETSLPLGSLLCITSCASRAVPSEGSCGRWLSGPSVAHGVWEQELAAEGQSQRAAGRFPPPPHTGRAPRGAPGDGACAVQTAGGAEAGPLCGHSGCAARGYQQSWKWVALCLKGKLRGISAVTFVALRFCFLACTGRAVRLHTQKIVTWR